MEYWVFGRYGRSIKQMLLVCPLLLAKALTANADRILLDNGDEINGEISSLATGVLKFKTPYAGELSVKWQQVRAIETDSLLWIGLIGEKEPKKRRTKIENSKLLIVDESGKGKSFLTVWPVDSISRIKPVLANSWEIKGTVNLGLDSEQGSDNDTTLMLDGTLNVNDQWNKNSFKYDMDFEQDNESGVSTQEWELGYAYSRYFTEHWFVQGNVDESYDSSDDPTSRFSVGASAGYRFRETAKETIIVTSGLSQLWEDYTDSEDKTTPAVSMGFEYKRKLFDRLDYHSSSKVYYRLLTGKWLFDGEHGIKVGLSKKLALNISQYLDYDSMPTDNDSSFVHQIKMGIGYSW